MQRIFEGTGGLAGVASRSWSKVVVTGVAACAVLAGCASGGDVTAADKQGTYVVSASATGGRLAWARAHKRAVSEATDYCESRGMQTSLGIEHTEGIEALQQQASVIRFECHPRT
ncbi:hypothetical protein [Paraburkholderia sp. J76]|uniref:hypothetical protein n=1 Tax=Paraburkholderia sp. J76 TaxID=2805439 RepID=UPI002ABDA7AC|nr:hypothetical protein [Paraburkholderia sp. J76]